MFSETYDQGGLQAVQLEDGTTAYIQHMPQSSTILAIQADGTVADLQAEGTIDPDTISVLEQYSAKVTITRLLQKVYSGHNKNVCCDTEVKPLLKFQGNSNTSELLFQMEGTECGTGLLSRGDADGSVHMQVQSSVLFLISFASLNNCTSFGPCESYMM